MAQHDEKNSALNRELEKLSKLREADIDKAINRASQTDDGRKFLWWLLQIGSVGIQPFTANALNTSFNCGKLDIGNQILARIISVDPAIYVRMMQENQDEYRKLEQRYAPGSSPSGDDSSGESA